MIGALREVAPADLVQAPLLKDRPVVVARAGHPLAGREPTTDDLTRFPWAIASRGTPLRRLWLRMFDEDGLAPPPVPVECGTVMTIRQFLIESDFLTLLAVDQLAVELKDRTSTRMKSR